MVSGIIQGSVVEPRLYTIFIESLLQAIRLPSAGYADDIKFIADATLYNTAVVQAEIDTVMQWSDANYTPLSVDKCGVPHCGEQTNHNVYYIKETVLKSFNKFKDLGVIRSAAISHASHYQAHYQQDITKAAQILGSIRFIFR